MADYKKIIEINADIRPAKNAFKDLEAAFSMSKKKIESTFGSELSSAIAALKPSVDKLFEGLNAKNVASILGDTAAFKEAVNKIIDAKNELYSTENGQAFLDKLDEAEQYNARINLMNLAGLKSEQAAIDSIKDAVDSGALSLSSEEMDELNDALNTRQAILDDIAKKQLDLNRLKVLDRDTSEEQLELEKKIAELKSKLRPSSPTATTASVPKSYGAKLGKDMLTGLDAMNPFNEEKLKKYKENGKYNTLLGASIGKIGEKFSNAMLNAIKNIGSFFVKTFKESFTNLSKMGEFSAGTSLFSNRQTRERQLMFGLTGAQNYAMSNAMSMLGMKDISDLMWGNAAQKAEYAKITKVLEEQYNKLESSGIIQTVQQFKLEFDLMKLQFQNTVYQFIAAHRDTIAKVLEMSLAFMEGVLNFLGWIVDGVSALWGKSSYSSSDILAASSTTNNSSVDNTRNIQATINYTNNQTSNDSGNVISESLMNQLIAVLNG